MSEKITKIVSVAAMIGGLMATAQQSSAASPSFNCYKATTPNEILICDHALLSKKDRIMANLYKDVRRHSNYEARLNLKREQRNWVKDRQRCYRDYECTLKSYEYRIKELDLQFNELGL